MSEDCLCKNPSYQRDVLIPQVGVIRKITQETPEQNDRIRFVLLNLLVRSDCTRLKTSCTRSSVVFIQLPPCSHRAVCSFINIIVLYIIS